ncbi:MAG TPA: CBS domain-containing protein [Sedimentisphaerales bacterium]|nr:CBS domain-containing protein [Sedimentisphaerales bacterium]
MLRAKDVMREDVVNVKKDTPIYEAVRLLRDNHITGVPVVDDDMALIGILSEKDVLSLLFYAYGDEEQKVVKDFMTQPPICFDQEESLLNVCDCLIMNGFRRVPITSNGRLVGIISRADLIDCILHLKRADSEMLGRQVNV